MMDGDPEMVEGPPVDDGIPGVVAGESALDAQVEEENGMRVGDDALPVEDAPAEAPAQGSAGVEEEEEEEEGSTEYETDDSSEYETDSGEEETDDEDEAEEAPPAKALAAAPAVGAAEESSVPLDEIALKEKEEAERARAAAKEAEAKRLEEERIAKEKAEAEKKRLKEEAAAEREQLKAEAAAAKKAAAEAQAREREAELARLQKEADEAAKERAIAMFATIEPETVSDPMVGTPFTGRLPENLKTVAVDLPPLEEGFGDAPVLDAVFVTDDLVLSSSSDGRVSLWSLLDNKVVAQFKPYGDEPVVFLHKLPVRDKGVLPILTLSAESRKLKTWHLTPDAATSVDDIQIPDNGKEVTMRLPFLDDDTARLAQKSKEGAFVSGEIEEQRLPSRQASRQEVAQKLSRGQSLADMFARGESITRGESVDDYDADPIAEETVLTSDELLNTRYMGDDDSVGVAPQVPSAPVAKASRSTSVKFATLPSVVEFAEERDYRSSMGMDDRTSSAGSVKDLASRFGGTTLAEPVDRTEHKQMLTEQLTSFGGASASSTPDVRTPRDDLTASVPVLAASGDEDDGEMPRTKSVAERMAMFAN